MTHTPSVGRVKRNRSQIESFRPASSSMSTLPLLLTATCETMIATQGQDAQYHWLHTAAPGRDVTSAEAWP